MANELERLNFELTERKVHIKFDKEFSGFSYEGFNVPRATKGSRTEVPFFIAEFLLSNSIIEDFTTDIPTSLQDLTALLRGELRSGELQPLHPFLHIIMRDFVLAKETEDSTYTELELKRRKSKFNQLTFERISKIVKLTDTNVNISRKKGNMTASEFLLFKKIINLVRSWKDEFIQK